MSSLMHPVKNIAIKQEGTTFTISTTENATFTNANVGNNVNGW